ncbi:MAG: zinc transporter ZupT [Candidatus Heimdallarchaeota archaeon]|nr:MAG: zinc transporter ZupT [Candidatus Heimdallarchaeota archaeon]
MVSFDQIIIALFLTTFAGLSTTIGAGIAFLKKDLSRRFLAIGLGFSGGAMIAVAFIELLPSAIEELDFLWGNIWFFIGILFIFLIDILLPHTYKEETEDINAANQDKDSELRKKIHRIGILSAVGIAIHNFPEGLVTFAGTLESVELGIVLALAIAMHNIPEGLSVSIPLQAAVNRRYAFKVSFLSGVAEPIGALLAATILLPFLSSEVLGAILAFVAGIMVFISFDELLPSAKNTDESHMVSLGIIVGMAIISLTLWMFKI